MDNLELGYLKSYSQKITAHNGDLSTLTTDERIHLKLLLLKHEIEDDLREIEQELILQG